MVDYYIEIHRNYGILLDTNILLLYLIGSFKIEFIKQFKRTCKYDLDDFEVIELVVSYFSKIVITPHILAEVWNFAEKITEPYLTGFIESSISKLEIFTEDYISKGEIIIDPHLLKLVGVTDLSIIIAAKSGNYLILTDDLRAYNAFLHSKVNAINLNHFKTERWFGSQ